MMGADRLTQVKPLRVPDPITSYSSSPSVWSAEGHMDSLRPSQQRSVVTAVGQTEEAHGASGYFLGDSY